MSFKPFYPGDPVPDFVLPATSNPKFHFNMAAGRYLVLCFFGSGAIEKNMKAVAHMTARRDLFDDQTASFFGISIDTADKAQNRVQQVLPGVRYFWDFERKVSTLYGAVNPEEIGVDGAITYRSFTLVVDPMLRVVAQISLHDIERHNQAFDSIMASLPKPSAESIAPVLVLPRIFEPEFCNHLIGLYAQQGGQESGYMTEMEGKTIGVIDHSFKRRKDFAFDTQPEYEPLRAQIRARLMRRLIPEMHKAFQFTATQMERYIVACYDGETEGFFRAHRDNTTKGTAHRRFACTINLNAEEFEGGELSFPEFGPRTYRAPTGGAVVFSCSLLHEARPVTKGTRYAFLPFFYDEAAAKQRSDNREFLTGKTINTLEGETLTQAAVSPFSHGESSSP